MDKFEEFIALLQSFQAEAEDPNTSDERLDEIGEIVDDLRVKLEAVEVELGFLSVIATSYSEDEELS